ncbi:MAG: FHA domain-containing protein [Salinibacter sp.]
MNRFAKDVAPLLRSFAWICLLMVLGAWGTPVQTEAAIGEVNGPPGTFRGQPVSIESTAARHVDSGRATETMNYVLQNDSGQETRTQTTKPSPETDGRYRVVRVVGTSPFSRRPALNKESRTQAASGSSQSAGTTSSESLRQGFSTVTVYLIMGLGALVVVVLAYFAYASQEDKPASRVSPGDGSPEPEPAAELSSTELAADDEEAADSGFPEPSSQRIKSESSSSQEPEETSEGPETLTFKAPPKTMKFVPGRLVIAAGPDQGKEFRIAGRPTPDGNVVTIGRAEVKGERAFAHIQLGDTYRTVSRMQAEVIQQDQTILLKNTSETNPTMVNGNQVPTGNTVELQDGDMIRMGELMLRYERD